MGAVFGDQDSIDRAFSGNNKKRLDSSSSLRLLQEERKKEKERLQLRKAQAEVEDIQVPEEIQDETLSALPKKKKKPEGNTSDLSSDKGSGDLSASQQAGIATGAALAGNQIQSQNPTSRTAGVAGGALSGAAVGSAGGPVGAAIGAAVGGGLGFLNASKAKRQAAADAENARRAAESKILGEKGNRIARALSGIRSSFSSALGRRNTLRLS